MSEYRSLARYMVYRRRSFSAMVPFGSLQGASNALANIVNGNMNCGSRATLYYHLFRGNDFTSSQQASRRRQSLASREVDVVSVLVLHRVYAGYVASFYFYFLCIRFVVVLLLVV